MENQIGLKLTKPYSVLFYDLNRTVAYIAEVI